jgi:hypothetical protein
MTSNHTHRHMCKDNEVHTHIVHGRNEVNGMYK